MPYIYENGELRFVSQTEIDAWNKANPVGDPDALFRELQQRNQASTTPAGGSILNITPNQAEAAPQSQGQIPEEILIPNTSNTSPDQILPETYQPYSSLNPVPPGADPEVPTGGEEDLVFLNTGQNLGVADEAGFVQTSTGLGILPEEQAVGVGDAPGEEDLVFLNTGENLGVADEAGFVQSSTGLNVLPEDQPPGEIDGYPQDLTPDVPISEPPGLEGAAREKALIEQARVQATLAAQRKQANEGDWRVKLRLGPAADYLYRDPEITQDGILYPLAVTDGVVFPYTPQINSVYHANYTSYDLTHSNYRGYFYQNSYVGEITLNATFTAQDTNEANYLLAVIHFFRSVTKMFYGKDAQRGSPPPLVFLQGLGEFQFNLHPCVVSQFNYNLPADVDYIRARSVSVAGSTQSLLYRRDRQNLPTNVFSGALERLRNAGLKKGAINTAPPAPPTFGVNRPTYVPTKIEITLVLLPVQTRSQVSQQFSLKQFANGDLKEGGFW